jgi:hypothetical protein
MWETLTPYSKAIGALLTAFTTWAGVVTTSASGPITAEEWVGLLGAVTTVIVVYLVPNRTEV